MTFRLQLFVYKQLNTQQTMKPEFLFRGQRIILIRGLPGSCKSTLAASLVNEAEARGVHISHYENDMYHYIDGVYRFDPDRQWDAVQWCKERTLEDILLGKTVIVSNVFGSLRTYNQYVNLANCLGINRTTLHCVSQRGTVHDVPKHVMESMAKSFEPIPDEIEVEAVDGKFIFTVPVEGFRTVHAEI